MTPPIFATDWVTRLATAWVTGLATVRAKGHTSDHVRDLARALAADFAEDFAALVWPVECAGCGAPNRACCRQCKAKLVRAALAADQFSDIEAGVLVESAIPFDPLRTSRPPPPCTVSKRPAQFVAGAHEGVLRDLLVAFKHAGRTSLAPILGEVLAVPLARAIARSCGPSPPLLIPIPSRPERVRERGFQHVEVLARAAMRSLVGRDSSVGGGHSGKRGKSATSRDSGRPPPTLVRALRTLPGRTGQVGLSVGQRRRNAARITIRKGAGKKILGRDVILVDDVRTTGESLAAAAILLTKSGATVVATVTLVQAKRHAPKK